MKPGLRVWFLSDGKRHEGILLTADDLVVVIKENGQRRVVVLPRDAEGEWWAPLTSDHSANGDH